MSTISTEISWLHLSDFHLRINQKWSQDIVLSSLLDDIRTRYSGQNKPDLVFITGDVAFSGQAEEYLLAEDFINKLKEATSVPAERLFIIPGNHDINRSLEEDAFRGVRIALKDAIEVDKFFANEGRRKTLFRRERAFRNFVNRVAPLDKGRYSPSSYAHSKQTSVGHINIRVSLLDSAWLAEGGETDIGTLLIGEPQIIEGSQTTDRTLNFGLVHHPFAWLLEFEQIPVENLLLDRVHIMLRGHVHSADQRSVEALERRLIFFTAGATYQTRTSDNTYSWCTLNLATGAGSIVLHKYIHATKRWQAFAPESWSLNKSVPPISLEDAMELLTQADGKYINYRATLLAGLMTEIPRLTNGTPLFLSFEVELADDENFLGKLIFKLRNLFFWRDIWNLGHWTEEVTRLAKQFEDTLMTLETSSSEIQSFLTEREQLCQRNVQVMTGSSQTSDRFPVLEEVEELAKTGEWQRIVEVINRWSSEELLTVEEQRKLDPYEVTSLIELGLFPDAIQKVVVILDRDEVVASDYHLAAKSYYVTKDYEAACKNMHLAIDKGIDIDAIRKLALLIAGKVGDRTLVERVKLHE